MTPSPVTCDERQLRSILLAEQLGDDQEAWMSHIEQCPWCQARLEALAAEPAVWQRAGEALAAESRENADDSTAPYLAKFTHSRALDGPLYWTDSLVHQLLAPPTHPEMLGRIGRYEVERIVGTGGMGVVFKAFDTELNRPVAVKVLAPFLAGSGSARKRFAREARAAAAIVHEHVVPIHNVEMERDTPFLVMQYVAGESLQARLDREGPLSTCEVLRIGLQMALGLAAAHQQGLVHRDIKPSNVLLEEGLERALITDFGLARAADDASLTCSGFHPGTPQFMSPEQAAGEAVDARSDLFSLGSVLYTMCTGRPPFRAESSLGVLRRIVDDEPRAIDEINPAVPAWLVQIISRLMAKKPADRFATAAELASLLKQCLAHLQQPASHALPESLRPRWSRNLWSLPFRTHSSSRVPNMTKFVLTLSLLLAAVPLALVAAYSFLQRDIPPAVAEMQGEWLIVASEREGQALPADQLYNERLVIKGHRFSRHQTAPNGQEINAEKGWIKIPEKATENGPGQAIDFELIPGVIYGRYQLKGDELILCVARFGGPRPDSLATQSGDSRSRQVFRRKPGSQATSPSAEDLQLSTDADSDAQRAAQNAWTEAWMKQVPRELTGSIERTAARQWMEKNQFESIASGEVSIEVVKRLHPQVDQKSLARDGVRTYLHGLRRSKLTANGDPAIEVLCLFNEADRMLSLYVGPQIKTNAEKPAPTPPGKSSDSGQEKQPRLPGESTTEPSTIPLRSSRTAVAESAPVVACLGPVQPVSLGDRAKASEIDSGLKSGTVRLHVWDWSHSDKSRVLHVQCSELGVLAPDGASMLTPEGEQMDLLTKKTRQYSGFQVTAAQRVVGVQVSPKNSHASVIIESPKDIDSPAAQEAATTTPHLNILRLLRLDPDQNVGRRIGEFPIRAGSAVAFAPDDSFLLYSTDGQTVVRLNLATGKLVNSYQPSLGESGAAALTISPDRRWFAAADQRGALYVWDVSSGQLRSQESGNSPAVEPRQVARAILLRFSSDGEKLAMLADGQLQIIEAASGKVVRSLPSDFGHVTHVQWEHSPQTLTLVSTSSSSGEITFPRIHAWNWEMEQPPRRQE